jgi:hypothetical protein
LTGWPPGTRLILRKERLWVPRTVSRPLTSAFPACEAATTNCSPISMIAL